MIPLYLVVQKLGWLNSLYAVIFPPMVSAYITFLVRQFMLTLPVELEDSARIDGASPPRIYWNIVLPLCGPVIAATIIFSFLSSWNAFIWPLLTLSSPENLTLPIGLTMIANARVNFGGYTPYGELMAAATAGAIPMILVFLVAQRQFVQGIAVTGIKG
jgi:multiple sugar transport system permease protein